MLYQSVFITGSSRGFGLELARRYANLGCQVFGLVRSHEGLQTLTQTVEGNVIPILADIREDSAIEIIQTTLLRQTDNLDLLINNAGIVGSGFLIEEVEVNNLKELMETHCYGSIRCIKAAWSLLKQTKGATIVNITSRLGSISKVAAGDFDHLSTSYAMRITKAAQNMFSACLHREARIYGICVYAIHPGRLHTRMGSADADLSVEEAAKRFIEWLPKIRQERDFGYFEPDTQEFSW